MDSIRRLLRGAWCPVPRIAKAVEAKRGGVIASKMPDLARRIESHDGGERRGPIGSIEPLVGAQSIW